MNFLKRALYSIKNRKFQTSLMILLFSVLFLFMFSGIVIYSTSENTIKNLKMSIANSVMFEPVDLRREVGGGSMASGTQLELNIVNKMLDSSYVQAYNITDFAFVDYAEEYHRIPRNFTYYYMEMNEATLYGMSYSEYDVAFTVNGYQLKEGEHFLPSDGGRRICFISEDFAECNDFQLGDKIKFKKEEKQIALEIVGFFKVPDGNYQEGVGISPKEIVMLPFDTLKEFTQNDRIIRATAFLKRAEDIDSYIAEVKEKGNVVKIRESSLDASEPELTDETRNMGLEELADYYQKNECFIIRLNRQWYDMVAKPVERVNHFVFVLVMGFILGNLCILVLICALNVRKRRREFGILLSVGEGKLKILLQMLLEISIPLLAAVLIGIPAGYFAGVPIVRHYTNGIYDVQAEIDTVSNRISSDSYIEKYYGDEVNRMSTGAVDLFFARSNNVKVMAQTEPQPDIRAVLSMVVIVFSLVFFVMVIQMLSILRMKPAGILWDR